MLKDLILRTAGMCDLDDTSISSISTQDQNRIKQGLNYAYHKIVKEKVARMYSENITLDENSEFNPNILSKKCIDILNITASNTADLIYQVSTNVKVPGITGTVTVYYNYLPPDMVNLEDIPDLPNEVDTDLLCYFAAYQYLAVEEESKAAIYLDMWQDGYSNLYNQRFRQSVIKDVYGEW